MIAGNIKIEDISAFKNRDYFIDLSGALENENGIKDLPKSLNKMIAGNIKIDDIPKFKNKSFFVDLSGALENKKGKKDILKINKLLNLSVI